MADDRRRLLQPRLARMKRLLSASAMTSLLWACAPDRSEDSEKLATGTADRNASSAPGAPTATQSAPDTGRVSQYTRLDECRLLESETEEGSYSVSACPGLAGYGLRLTEDDLRQDLVVEMPGGGERSLALSEATSGGFSRIGESVEWRGGVEDGRFRPDAMIVRYFVVEDPDAPDKETAYLVTVSLANGRPCVAGRLAPGPDQNERARRMADGPLRCV